jgi:bleomycin hydrolase
MRKAVLGTSKKFRAPWTAVPVSGVEHWEIELLQDPKNRSVPLFFIPRHI